MFQFINHENILGWHDAKLQTPIGSSCLTPIKITIGHMWIINVGHLWKINVGHLWKILIMAVITTEINHFTKTRLLLEI